MKKLLFIISLLIFPSYFLYAENTGTLSRYKFPSSVLLERNFLYEKTPLEEFVSQYASGNYLSAVILLGSIVFPYFLALSIIVMII